MLARPDNTIVCGLAMDSRQLALFEHIKVATFEE